MSGSAVAPARHRQGVSSVESGLTSSIYAALIGPLQREGSDYQTTAASVEPIDPHQQARRQMAEAQLEKKATYISIRRRTSKTG